MESEGIVFNRAVLSMNLMIDDRSISSEPALISYYVRFGATTTQVMLPLLSHAGIDVYRLFRSAAEGKIEKPSINPNDIGHAAVTLCLATAGYPASPRGGDKISGLDRRYDNVTVQLTDVVIDDKGDIITSEHGGRALYVTGYGENRSAAAKSAYAAVGKNAINFDGIQYRKEGSLTRSEI